METTLGVQEGRQKSVTNVKSQTKSTMRPKRKIQ